MQNAPARVCAIHQPNFFPWIGYFDKIRRADVFVLLDAVAYPKSGNSMGSWVNRVRISINGEAVWIRVPVVREHGAQAINRVRIDEASPWRDGLLRTLDINYRRAPRFTAAMALLEPLILHRCELLADYNAHAIQHLAAALRLPCRFVRQSEMHVAGSSTELLVNLVRVAGAAVYLSGDGAGGYQENDLFGNAGIELRKSNYAPGPYGDGAFVPGLSIIDYLMHCEPAAFGEQVGTHD